VTAVAASGNAAQIRDAAHSDCGKPMVAAGHGGGPPEHALEHMAAGKAHAGGKAEDEGSGAAGKAHAGGKAEDEGSGGVGKLTSIWHGGARAWSQELP